MLPISIRDIIEVLFKRKILIISVFFGVLVVLTTIFLFLPNYFEAKAVLMVTSGRELVPTPEVNNAKSPTMSQEGIVATQMEIISGKDLMKRVVQAVPYDHIYPDLSKGEAPRSIKEEIAAFKLSKDVVVKDIKRTNLIEIAFTHKNPHVVTGVLKALIGQLGDSHAELFNSNKQPYFEEQLRVHHDRLKNSEQQLLAYKLTHQMFSAEDQRTLLLREQSETQLLLRQEIAKLSELRGKLEMAKSANSPVYETVVNELRTQLHALYRKEQDYAGRFSDASHAMAGIKSEIQLTKKQLKEEEANQRRVDIDRISNEARPLEIKIATLRGQLSQLERKIRELDTNAIEYAALKAEVALNESNYETYLKKQEEMRALEDLTRKHIINVAVIEPPGLPVALFHPWRNKILFGGIPLALIAGIGIAFLIEFIPLTIVSPEFCRKVLRSPVLTIISR